MTVLEHQVVAHNDAADSGNPMHDDAAAQALDFAGALVPGVTVYGYMTGVVVEHFGETWLDGGGMGVRFRRPVYVGDSMRIVAASNDDGTLSVDAINQAGEICVIGRAFMDVAGDRLSALFATPAPPVAGLPESKRPATRTACAADAVLGSIDARFDPATGKDFVAAMQDPHAVYQHGVIHPAWLLRQANLVVDANLALGPWIHVGSELKNLRRCRNGESLVVRARFLELYERKGSEYADIDVAVSAADDPGRLRMRALHRFIYRYSPSAQ